MLAVFLIDVWQIASQGVFQDNAYFLMHSVSDLLEAYGLDRLMAKEAY